MIEEEDRQLTESGSWRVARVPKDGGDEMQQGNFLAQLDAMIAGANDPQTEEAAEEQEVVAEMAQAVADADAEKADVLEKDFDRGIVPSSEPPPSDPIPPTDPVPVATTPTETPEQKARRLELNKPIIGAISTEKMVHGNMILNGICTECVRCKLKLTDAVSVERGMGPECSSKGYAEDPTNPDEMGAMIELSEYPALVEFLTQHYKPLGIRGMMNGLVRIAALNRKSPVHAACANAIEALGYKNLAATLRDSLAIMWIKDSERHPGHYHVRVRGKEWTREWSQDCYRNIPHAFFDKAEKGLIVAKRPETKRALWKQMMHHYGGLCAKTDKGTVRIPTEEEWEALQEKRRQERAACGTVHAQ